MTERTPPSAEDVFESIHAVMHLFRAEQYRVLRDGPHALSHMESKALGYFARHPGATQSDLAAHAGRDKGQVARLIATLRDGGLLDARPDPDDRRNTRLHVTDAGRAIQQVLQRQARRLSERAVDGLSPDERGRLVGLLDRVRGNLAEN